MIAGFEFVEQRFYRSIICQSSERCDCLQSNVHIQSARAIQPIQQRRDRTPVADIAQSDGRCFLDRDVWIAQRIAQRLDRSDIAKPTKFRRGILANVVHARSKMREQLLQKRTIGIQLSTESPDFPKLRVRRPLHHASVDASCEAELSAEVLLQNVM